MTATATLRASPRGARYRSAWRATLWWPIAVSAVIATLALGSWAAWGHFDDPSEPIGAMRVVAVLLALGTGFALDDEALPSLAASPTPYARRRSRHIAVVVPIGAGTWTALLLSAQAAAPIPVPMFALSLEAASMCLVSLALAALLQRGRGLTEPGLLAAPCLLALLLVADALTDAWPLMIEPGPQWNLAHWHWAGVGAAAAIALAVTARDPARGTTHPQPRVRPRRASPAARPG